MQVHYGLDTFAPCPYTVVTSGTFDGVHFGHQKILKRVVEFTHNCSQAAESVLLKSPQHPRLVLFPDQKDLKLLTSLEEKIDLVAQQGIDHFVVIPFDKNFAAQSSQDFIENILIKKLTTKQLVIGYDHKFGKNREGGFDYLKANEHLFGFRVEEIPRQDIDDIAVSSTKIRHALEEGNITLANHLLQYNYSLTGKVVRGNQIGRTIGFPTANLAPFSHKLVPAEGIYAVWATFQTNTYPAMLYIGRRTTLGEGLERTVEVNLFDFDKEIYDEILTLKFVKKLRGEEKFDSLAAMQAQLVIDRKDTLAALFVTI